MFGQYCKKRNHSIADCRSRIYNENKINQGEHSGSNNANNQVKRTVGDIENLVRTITYMEREHGKYYSPSFIQNETILFVDSGADMSLIKLSTLKKHIIVNESERRTISGITFRSRKNLWHNHNNYDH
jgi:hypothetical protein